VAWHTLGADQVLRSEGVDGQRGLLKAATLEIDESALTGESLPVAKDTEPVAGIGTPLGDRTDMAYMTQEAAVMILTDDNC